MLNFGEKNSHFARQKKKIILTLVLSEKKILSKAKNHNPLFKLNGRTLKKDCLQNKHHYNEIALHSFLEKWLFPLMIFP